MKKMLLSLAFLAPICAQADSFKTFADVAYATAKGKKLTFVVNIAKCNMDNPPQIIASLRPNAVMIVNNNRITASERHFTINSPAFPGTAVYEYIKINITSDNNVSLGFTTLNATDYSQLRTMQVDCQLNEGLKVYD